MRKTLTEAINSQPSVVKVAGASETSTNVRQVPYAELYRESTGVLETPAQRLQRIAAADIPVSN